MFTLGNNLFPNWRNSIILQTSTWLHLRHVKTLNKVDLKELRHGKTGPMLWLATVALTLVRGQDCLTGLVEVVPEEQRQLLANEKPLGVWNVYGNKFQVDTPVALLQILVEEILGYRVAVTPRYAGNMNHVYYALAGCEEPENEMNQSCTGKPSNFHVSLGLHVSNTSQIHMARVQRLKIGGMLEDLGHMGTPSSTGLMISRATVQRALEDDSPLFLDDWRSYDGRYHQPQRFFRRLEDLEGALISCDAWAMEPGEYLTRYAALTGDFEGLRFTVDGVRPRCWRDVWWLAPACRNSTDCFPCLTGSASGYNVILAEEVMQKAAFWHMPLALGVAHYNGSSDFSSLVLSQRDVLFMFWEPSVEFQAVDPMFVRFPDFNETQWAFNVMASKREATWPITVVSNELAQLAPDVRVLLQRMLLSLEDLNQMLQFSYDSLERFDRCFSCAARSGACQWLRAQGTDAIWKPWIPKKGACFAGQGMYSITERRFVGSRGDDVICVACTAGRFSRLVQDEMGDTADCRPCAKGYFQPSSSAVSCDPCPMGRFAASARSAYCESCPIGTYQAKEASSACVDCPIGMTTWGLEAFSFFFCTCQEGWYRIGLESNCSECPAGMHCPGEAFLPQQKAGFWAYTTNLIQRDPNVAVVSVGSLGSSGVLYGPPYSVYQCRNELQCPAGEVMTCAKNRIGQACGSCMKGHSAQFDGTCKICDGESLWPVFLMLFVSLALLPLIVAAGLIMTKARRTALSVFMVSLIFGQIVVCLQGLDAIYQLDLTWKDPAKAILAALAVFNLDLEFSCLLPPQSYTVEYVLKLLAYPAVVFITFLAWLSTRCSKHAVPFNAFVNVHGLFVVALLTALSLTVVRPLQCRSNPNGLFTVSSRPDLTCWETEEHQTLVVFVSIGILAYPVTILSCIAYLTRKYPIWLRSGGGIKVMERYRFLFARFRPERYYFGLILSVHNLTVAVIPAALVAFPALQVGIMGCVICSKLVAQILLWPWRMDLANYNDAALSAGLMTILLLASPLLNIDQGQTRQSVAVLLSCVMILLPLVAIFIAFAVVLARLRPQSKFGAFLCHHKAGAGALCRFFKLVAKKYVNINLFLDSDELDDLARIFDIVKADTRSLVVVLTSELLHRMWCAGEIATAHKHQIPIIPLYCDDFGFPDASCIATMESVWSEEQRGTLVSHGISMEDIKAAYRSLRTLPGVDLKRRWSLEAQEDAVLQVLTAVYERGPRVEVATAPSVKSAKVLVCVTEEAEAISAGFILQQMVQTKLQTVTFLARTPEDVFESASFALVILSKGILEDCGFAQILLAIRRASVALVPVNDGSFDFPGLEFYQQVQEGNLVIPGLAPNQGPPLARAFQALLSILALPMTPHASIGILERQVDQICQRFGNWDDVVECVLRH